MVDLYISKEDFRPPAVMIGKELDGEEQRKFQILKEKIHRLNHLMKPTEDYYLDFVDSINDIIQDDPSDSRSVLRNVFRYLRVQLLSRSNIKVCNTITLCDVLVKNCGAPVHAQISRRGFMRYLSLSIRRHITLHGDSKGREVGMYAFDILQGWAEAFEKRPGYCTNVINTYLLLQKRHGLRFGPQYGVGRVPIFLPEPQEMYNLPHPDIESDSEDEIGNEKTDCISKKPASPDAKKCASTDLIDLNATESSQIPVIETLIPFQQNPLLEGSSSTRGGCSDIQKETR